MTDQPRERITIDAPDGSTILAARHLDATEGRVQVGSTVDTSTRSAIDRVLGYVARAHNQTGPTACGHEAELDRLTAELADYDQRAEQQKQRADEAEQHLRNIAQGGPRTDAVQAEIGEMIRQTHELRDQLRRAEAELRQHAENESADAAAGSYAGRAERVEAALERVRRRATQARDLAADGLNDYRIGRHDLAVDVLAELDSTEPGPTATEATEATDVETTARVFAALHRSAEETVTRVIDLYERWVKAGAPPLGVPTARWWDRRLVELRGAIHTAAEESSRTTPDNPPASDDLAEQLRAAIESEMYEYRERTMWWPETGGITEEIARLATRGALEVLGEQPVPEWAPPPPGSTAEQLPETLLALIRDRLPDYTSTACQTADAFACAACYPGSGIPRPQYDEIREHAERLHERCRINHKFTGQLCACGCHPEEQQPYPPIGLTNQGNHP